MKKRTALINLTALLFLAMLFQTAASAEVDKGAVIKRVSRLQVPFIENQGQVRDGSVRFYADTFAGRVYVTDRAEIVYGLLKRDLKTKDGSGGDINSTPRPKASRSKIMVLRESIEGQTLSLRPRGVNRSVARVNHFTGKKENWRTGIQTWQEVSLGEVYPGIELRLRAYGDNVEKLFTVRPGAQVEKILLKVEGAQGLSVNEEGELEIETSLGTVKMTRPVAYQEIDGRRIEVAADYVVSRRDRELTYRFHVGQYDRTKPLVIDPLLASTFLGGGRTDKATSVVVDNSGNVYVSGGTYSSDFPTTPGAFDVIFSYTEAFVSKFDADLEELLASTFIGPAFSGSITIGKGGGIYVFGITPSPDFPTTPGAYARTIGNYDPDPMVPYDYFYDGFISILDGDLENLRASTYVGLRTDDDFSGRIDIAVDKNGDVYMAASTLCSYVGTGIYCALAAKFDGKLETRLASKVLPRDSGADAISVDDSGNVYVAGTGNNIPTTPGAYDTTPNGYLDVFVAKFDADLEGVLAATYLGGAYLEYPRSVVIDGSGDIYVAGWTRSEDFPTTRGAYDRTLDGDTDAFISKFDGDLETLLASTLLGGDDDDGAADLTVDGEGEVYVTGWTRSTDFPATAGVYDSTPNGDYDAFLATFDGNLGRPLSSSYLGGTAMDYANALTVDGDGNVYVAGVTASDDFPTTGEGFDGSYNGGERGDAFVSKLSVGRGGGRHFTTREKRPD